MNNSLQIMLKKALPPLKLIDVNSRIGHIKPDILKYNIEKITWTLLKDFSQATTKEEADHLINRICTELSYKNQPLIWSEVLYMFERGIENHWGESFKIDTRTIFKWLSAYKREKQQKHFTLNDQSYLLNKKTEKAAPYISNHMFGTAIILRKKHPELFDPHYTLKEVAEMLKKGMTVEQIIKSK